MSAKNVAKLMAENHGYMSCGSAIQLLADTNVDCVRSGKSNRLVWCQNIKMYRVLVEINAYLRRN